MQTTSPSTKFTPLTPLQMQVVQSLAAGSSVSAAARLKAAIEIVKMVDAQRATAHTESAPAETAPTEEPAPASAERTQSPASQAATVGRNSPCPCGSSLKYKRCCGDPLHRRKLSPAAATHAPQITANRPEFDRSPAPEMALPAPPH